MMMMNGLLLLLTISIMVLLSKAVDDTQQLEASSAIAKPEVSNFVQQLVLSARHRRSLGFNADGVFSGLSERNLDAKHHRAAALELRELEKMSELGEGENDQEQQTEGLEDEDEEELADRMAQQVAQHDQAHQTLKRIHSAMKQGVNPPSMHKRQNQCSIGGNGNNQWCHNSPWG